MNNMPGNPHYEDYVKDLDADGPYDDAIMQLHATLALAFEQRTANLIAERNYLGALPETEQGEGWLDALDNLQGQIDQRLGLTKEKES